MTRATCIWQPRAEGQILKGWNYVATQGRLVNAPNWWWKAIGVPQGMCRAWC